MNTKAEGKEWNQRAPRFLAWASEEMVTMFTEKGKTGVGCQVEWQSKYFFLICFAHVKSEMSIIWPSYFHHTCNVWLCEAGVQRRGQAKDINVDVSAYRWHLKLWGTGQGHSGRKCKERSEIQGLSLRAEFSGWEENRGLMRMEGTAGEYNSVKAK